MPFLHWLRSFPLTPQRAHARRQYRASWQMLTATAGELNAIDYGLARAAHLRRMSDLSTTIANVALLAYGRRGRQRAAEAVDESRFAHVAAEVEFARVSGRPRRRDWPALEERASGLLDLLSDPSLSDAKLADAYAFLQTRIRDLVVTTSPVRVLNQLQQWHAARAAAADDR
jgi:hypothetical protein